MISIPNFKKSLCKYFTVCSEIISENSELKKLIPKRYIYMVASYETPSGKAFLRIIGNRGKKIHLHIDCALDKFFPKNKKPKVTNEKQDILSIIEKFIGESVNVDVHAGYILPFNLIAKNSLIDIFSAEQGSADISLKLTSATFSLKGVPINKLQWIILEEGKIYIKLETQKELEIKNTYITDLFQEIEKLFNVFIIGRYKNANGEVS